MTCRGHHTQFICKSFIISNNICPLETCKFHNKKESRLDIDKPTLLVSANSWEACSVLRAVLTKFYKLTAQEVWSPNSKCQRGSENSRNAVPSPSLGFWYCCQSLVFCDLCGHHSKFGLIMWYNSSVSQWDYSHIGSKGHILVQPHNNSLSC